MTCAPVNTAMSCSISLRRSPKPGAVTATQVNVSMEPINTSVAIASPSTIFGNKQHRFALLHDLLQHRNKFLDRRELFIHNQNIRILEACPHQRGTVRNNHGRIACFPSVPALPRILLTSSTVITPSLPTCFIAFATSSPTLSSTAEIAATYAMDCFP